MISIQMFSIDKFHCNITGQRECLCLELNDCFASTNFIPCSESYKVYFIE